MGAVDDARPDRWGERVIQKFERSPRLSILEFLLFAGDDRYGALGVGPVSPTNQPWRRSPIPTLGELDALQEVIRRVLAGERSTRSKIACCVRASHWAAPVQSRSFRSTGSPGS